MSFFWLIVNCIVYFFRDDASEEAKQTITIAEKYIHPGYDTPDKANDIALLKLKEPIRMGPTISPPCIPDQNDFGDSSSFPAGSGFLPYWIDFLADNKRFLIWSKIA